MLFAGDMEIGSRAVAYGKPVLFAGGLELASDAVLRGGAVLFFGNVHLHEGAQVRGDVILVEGDATLDDQSVILGKLYLNPESNLGRERLYQSSSAEITRGVIQSENIMSVAGWRVGGWVMVHVFSFILLAVWILGLLIVFIFYLGRLSNLLKQKNAARARYTQPNPQLTSLD